MSEPTETVSDSTTSAAWSAQRQWRTLAGLAAGVLLVAVALWLWHRRGHADAPAEAPVATNAFRASDAQLKTFAIEAVANRGFQGEERTDGKIAVNADRATPVYSPYSGRVTRVVAGLGDAVVAGAPLAYVEASEFAQAQSDLNTAAATERLAVLNEARKKALYEAKGGSLQDWQQAQSDLAAAQATLSVARNKLSILGRSPAQIAELERGQVQGQATSAVAAISAPLAGVVVDRQIGPGQFLQAGSGTAVYTIADVGSVWLVANVRESSAARIRRGQAVEVRVPAYPDRIFSARVTYVAPTVDPATHRVAVRAELDNRDGALKPEMFATFRILTGASVQAPGVPDSAVVYEGDAAHVWVARADQSIEYRAIRVGRSLDGWVEVLDGLKAGERIVTKGSLFIDRAARAE